MNSGIKKTSFLDFIEIHSIFELVTWLNMMIFGIMFVLSMVVNLERYITALLFVCTLLGVIFFLQAKKDQKSEKNEILFLLVIFMIAIPVSYICIGLEICEIPIYFVLGIIYTAVIVTGRNRVILIILQTLEYSAAIWYVNITDSNGIYNTSMLPVDIYIRLLLAVVVAGTAGGILLKYRNRILLEEIDRGEKKARREEEINEERNGFIKNLSHVLNIFLHKILSTTEMLVRMNIEVQRKEDILFIDSSARELSKLADKLGDREDMETEKSYEKPILLTGKIICPGASVLVVDDNVINLEIVKSMLQQFQCKVLGAMSGKECLEVLAKERPDIILLDYMMPEMDGLETLKRIRETEKDAEKEIPVIMLTADVESGAKEEFINAGFNDYMEKPVEIAQIQRMFEKYLDRDKIVRGQNG